MQRNEDHSQQKTEARRAFLRLRAGLPEAERRQRSRLFCERLLQNEAFCAARRLCAYRPFGAELDIEPAMDAARRAGKSVAYPICGPLRQLTAAVPTEGRWARSSFGLWEPLPEASEAVPPEELDLVLLPCVAFDGQKNRLGYGGGYYDRFLPRCAKAHILLVAFELQRAEALFPEAWDVRPHRVLTENSFF